MRRAYSLPSFQSHNAAPLTAASVRPVNFKQLKTAPAYCGPELTMNLNTITAQVGEFKQALPQVKPHFAVKANPLPELIQHLQKLNVCFEIASQGELELLKSLNIPPADIIFSNPIKTPASIKAAQAYGIKWFAFDCKEELDKLFKLAPKAFYELRLSTSGHGAVWPLSIKFGVNESEAAQLIRYAAQHKMPVAGLTFHVGSQCTRAQSWVDAIHQCCELFTLMSQLDLPAQLLNLGGGFPCAISKNSPVLPSLMKPIQSVLATLPSGIQLVAEPGRFLMAAAGTLSCQIISTTTRQNKPWAFLDCGYYNGLMELKENFGYEMKSHRGGPLQEWIIAGPTCDSIDMFDQAFLLPVASAPGDIINIPNMGAYANTCATTFNGFAVPKVKILPE